MNRSKCGVLAGILAAGWLGSLQCAFAFPVLSGLINFSTDATGANSDVSIWNTLGGDGRFNLYVTAPNSGINGTFLNTGNDAGASVNLPLSVGTSTFYLFGEPGADIGYFGLNLFFGGDNTHPGISVFAASDQPPSPPYPAFSADASPSTHALDSSTTAGAGTLMFSDGAYDVTLTDYRWSVPGVENLDRVGAYDTTPDGANDFVGSMTLVVTAVPEPTSFGLIVAATLMLRRRSTKAR